MQSKWNEIHIIFQNNNGLLLVYQRFELHNFSTKFLLKVSWLRLLKLKVKYAFQQKTIWEAKLNFGVCIHQHI